MELSLQLSPRRRLKKEEAKKANFDLLAKNLILNAQNYLRMIPLVYNHSMRFLFLVVLIVIFASGCSFIFKETEAEIKEREKLVTNANDSRLIILDVYHKNCKSCKLIEPVIEELKTLHSENKDIVFLKYDLSNPITIFKSKQIANALGLEQIYNLQRYSGLVLFIDSRKKQVTDTLIAEYNIEKYNEVVREKLRN